MTWVKRGKGWRMSCDVGEVTERLENELCSTSYTMGGSLGELNEELMTQEK